MLIGAQMAWLMGAGRGHYWWLLVLAVAGFVGGELFAIVSHLGGPLLGGLHPVADLAGIALVQVTARLLGPDHPSP